MPVSPVSPRSQRVWCLAGLLLLCLLAVAGCAARDRLAVVATSTATPTLAIRAVPTFTPTATAIPRPTVTPSPTPRPTRFPTITPTPVHAEGIYGDLAAHHHGSYRLQVIGPTVLLNLTAVHAPVQHQARQKPTVLLRVPDAWRPDAPVTWQVEGWPVLADGTPDPQGQGPHVFTLQVDPHGDVSYVDSAQLEPVGYLRYAATLAWPVASAPPQVCARSDEIQAAILEALAPADEPRPYCATVTWDQLATIRTLGQPEQPDRDPIRVIHANDLAGLSGLEAASLLFAGTSWQPDLLVQVPRLRRLWLETARYLTHIPAGVFASVPLPALTHLTLNGVRLRSLPSGWLAPLPGLTHLTLKARYLRDLPPGWLPTLPQLAYLNVYANPRELAPGWLPPQPALTYLEIDIALTGNLIWTEDRGWVEDSIQHLPAEWLPPLPALTHLILDANYVRSLSADWLQSVPHLTHLEFSAISLRDLPPDWLQSVPHLTHLELQAFGLKDMPVDWWPYLPALSHLKVRNLKDLPRDWPRRVPGLTHLELGYDPQGKLPLPPTLTHLILAMDYGGVWSAGRLPALPDLTHLTLDLSPFVATRKNFESLQGLPPDFLPDLPSLTHLRLDMGTVQGLAPDWQLDWPWLPALTHLELVAPPPLEHLSSGWLPLWPTLTHLSLESEHLRSLDSGWLPPLPLLTHLSLDAQLRHLPAHWLPRLPALTHLTLDVSGNRARFERDYFRVRGQHGEPILNPDHLGTLTTMAGDSLTSVPALTHLTLYADGMATWPPDFLRPVPLLSHLALDLRGMATWPPDSLAPVSALTHLTLYADGMATWPPGLLTYAPGLIHLLLAVDTLRELPPDFLAQTPYVEELALFADGLSTLPDTFLSSAPHLEKVGLYADGLAELPPEFLTSAPQLQEVFLWGSCLSAVPPNFLRTASHEVQLFWQGTRWKLPADHLWVHLWDLNRHYGDYPGLHIAATEPVVNLRDQPSLTQSQVVGYMAGGKDAFTVIDRQIDETGRLWLRLWFVPWVRNGWGPRVESVSEEIWIAADYVEFLQSRGGWGWLSIH